MPPEHVHEHRGEDDGRTQGQKERPQLLNRSDEFRPRHQPDLGKKYRQAEISQSFGVPRLGTPSDQSHCTVADPLLRGCSVLHTSQSWLGSVFSISRADEHHRNR
jgi:hypothetical protein